MKKALKIMIPIFLTLTILLSLAWYLLVYDPGFTRDVLLRQARYYDSQNKHSVAAWFYDLAYYQSSNDPAVAIELAEQYKSIGNFTKAEYTLSKAIAQGGSVELYISLCKTYVEQDKLMDAVAMLENVSDPQIKAQLEERRPTAPVADYEPGFYTQYISVNLTAPMGILYTNVNGEYPSTEDGPSSNSVTLSAGETTIYAIAVTKEGLVSPLTILGYTVGGVVEPITFTDAAVEAKVREMLSLGENTVVYSNDLWKITEFELPAEAESCADIALMPYLQKLTIHSETADLSPIAQFSQLTALDLSGCRPTEADLNAIGAMTSLEVLDLSSCNLSSISGLEGAVALRQLNLENNAIRNLEPLRKLSALESINLAHNAVVTLDALVPLTKLKDLDVSYNSLTSLKTVSGCGSLTALKASNNAIDTLSGVDRLNNLTVLDLSGNQVADVTGLSGLVKLSELNLSDNLLTDISMLNTLTALTDFRFANNQVPALPEWPNSLPLVVIDGTSNLLENLDVLGGMAYLNQVYMDYNQLTTIEPLLHCTRLIKVNIFGNEEITDVSGLEAMDVLVNYSPDTTITE